MLHIITTGGTIDKVYFDALSEFQVGEAAIDAILKDANVAFDYEITQLMRKDSLELTDADRAEICACVQGGPHQAVLVTHGTDTMADSARLLTGITNKTVVFTGAMQPARIKSTDAIFNVGFAIAAAFTRPPGAYIAINGQIFDPDKTVKDRAKGRFVQR